MCACTCCCKEAANRTQHLETLNPSLSFSAPAYDVEQLKPCHTTTQAPTCTWLPPSPAAAGTAGLHGTCTAAASRRGASTTTQHTFGPSACATPRNRAADNCMHVQITHRKAAHLSQHRQQGQQPTPYLALNLVRPQLVPAVLLEELAGLVVAPDRHQLHRQGAGCMCEWFAMLTQAGSRRCCCSGGGLLAAGNNETTASTAHPQLLLCPGVQGGGPAGRASETAR